VKLRSVLLIVAFFSSALFGATTAEPHKNFHIAVYIPVSIVQRMHDDPQWLQDSFDRITSQVKVDKVYIETYRSRRIANDETIEQVKKFFLDHGVQVAGGIAYSADDGGQFISFSYTDPQEREYVKHVAALTAKHFDDIILDDFFFNSTKYDSDIAAKGNLSWTQFRLKEMDEAARDLVIDGARAVNPHVKITIKFPNWYEHFQANGYDLDVEPKMFDAIYTGTETRDPVITDQHLQQYESYQIVRYFDNVAPGRNLGGWVDTFDLRYVDRYAEQLWDTLFAKAPELMLFNWYNLLDDTKPGDRGAWQGEHTTFDYEAMLKRHRQSGSSAAPNMASVAGYSVAEVDQVLGELGKPIGIASYRPYHSVGEDFLHDYLGMIGIPIDLHPEFPAAADTVLLTQDASYDPQIVEKIEAHLAAGKNVVITSGLLHALEGKGIEDIAELRYTDHKLSPDSYFAAFGPGGGAQLGKGQGKGILFPEILFMTNDAWPVVRGTANGRGVPLLLMDKYSKGVLYVLTIPDNFNDLYSLPADVLSAIKSYVMAGFPVRIDAPAGVSLFAYDNHTFVVESFLDHDVSATAKLPAGTAKLSNLTSERMIAPSPEPTAAATRRRYRPPQFARFAFTVKPHSFVVFKY
jgi:hypothetical protein